MKFTLLLTLLSISSINLLGYTLIPAKQLREDGRRLINPRHIDELEKVLSELDDESVTESGWPAKIAFYDALLPKGGPSKTDPAKVRRLCDEYKEVYGETPDYNRLKVNYLLMVIGRANFYGLDGNRKLDDRGAFVAPLIKEADQMLDAFALDERDSLWYMQKGKVLFLQDENIEEWISGVRKNYPKHPNLLLALIEENNMTEEMIEAEIASRGLDIESADILYAQVFTVLWGQGPSRSKQERYAPDVDWERLMNGIWERYQAYPTDYNYDVYRFFACYIEDKDLARKLFEEGPDRPQTYLWSSSDFPFEDWKAWATGENTFPKLEQEKMLFGVWKQVDRYSIYPERSHEYYRRRPTYYIFDEEHKLQIIGKYRGGMNHKTRDWEIVSPGHVRITNLTNDRTWSETMFCDGKALVVQLLARPYGTSYYEYVGTVEEALPKINETYHELNPGKKVKKPRK